MCVYSASRQLVREVVVADSVDALVVIAAKRYPFLISEFAEGGYLLSQLEPRRHCFNAAIELLKVGNGLGWNYPRLHKSFPKYNTQ